MSRIPLVETDTEDRLLRRMFGQMEKSYGAVPHTARALANVPGYVGYVAGLGSIEFHEGELPKSLKLLAKLRVAHLNQCAFCIDSGAARALEAGIDAEKIAALAHDDTHSLAMWSLEEQKILEYTDASAKMNVSDALFEETKKHFSEAQIIELTTQIAVETFYNVLNRSFGIDAQGFCALREQLKTGE